MEIIIIIIIIIWFLLCFVVANAWKNVGLSYSNGFWNSLFFSPLVGISLGILHVCGRGTSEAVSLGTMKKCPYCAELIKREAIVCRYCGKDLPIDTQSSVTKNIMKELKPDEKGKYHCPHCSCVIDQKDVNANKCWYCKRQLINV